MQRQGGLNFNMTQFQHHFNTFQHISTHVNTYQHISTRFNWQDSISGYEPYLVDLPVKNNALAAPNIQKPSLSNKCGSSLIAKRLLVP